MNSSPMAKMKTMLSKKSFKISLIALALLLLTCLLAYYRIPQVNILTKVMTAKAVQSALSIYDPLNKKTSDSPLKFPAIPENFTHNEDTLYEILKPFSIKILHFKNAHPFLSKLKFYYQVYNEPKLKTLRLTYNLSRFRKNPDFSGFLLLKDWLRQKYSHGSNPKDLTFFNFDCLQLMNQAGAQQTFDCGAFSYIYVQCILSIGGQARVVLLQDKGGKGHVVSEIWSNDWDKWIVVDVDHNLYYAHNGIPLNALELHNAYIKRNSDEIETIRGPPLKEEMETQNLEQELSKYYTFAIRMRNDFFNKYPRWHYKGNLYTNCVQWIDEKTPKLLRYGYASEKKEDLYWYLNKSTLYFKPDEKFEQNKAVNIYLQTHTPNFKCFSIKFNNLEERRLYSSEITWKLHEGKNSLQVCSVNQFDIHGKESRIDLTLSKQR